MSLSFRNFCHTVRLCHAPPLLIIIRDWPCAATTASSNVIGGTATGAVTTTTASPAPNLLTDRPVITSATFGTTTVTLAGYISTAAGVTELTATATDAALNTSELSANVTVGSPMVSGRVFEDLIYGGSSGRTRITASGNGGGRAVQPAWMVCCSWTWGNVGVPEGLVAGPHWAAAGAPVSSKPLARHDSDRAHHALLTPT